MSSSLPRLAIALTNEWRRSRRLTPARGRSPAPLGPPHPCVVGSAQSRPRHTSARWRGSPRRRLSLQTPRLKNGDEAFPYLRLQRRGAVRRSTAGQRGVPAVGAHAPQPPSSPTRRALGHRARLETTIVLQAGPASPVQSIAEGLRPLGGPGSLVGGGGGDRPGQGHEQVSGGARLPLPQRLLPHRPLSPCTCVPLLPVLAWGSEPTRTVPPPVPGAAGEVQGRVGRGRRAWRRAPSAPRA